MKQSLLLLAIIMSLLCSAIFANGVSANKYTSGAGLTNPVSGRITTDTTWTKENSPYQVTDPLYVNPGVTLTIAPGVKVELWTETICIQGTLQARGTTTDKITFTNGGLLFTETSNAWNEEAGTGNVLENCIIEAVTSRNAVKINQCTTASLTVGGASIISNNAIRGSINATGSAVVWKNNVVGDIFNGIAGTPDNFPIIVGNTIHASQWQYGTSGISCKGYVLVTDNVVSHCYWGIAISSGKDEQRNLVWPNAKVENNRITGCDEGIRVETPNVAVNGSIHPAILNNEITQNRWGIHLTRDARQVTITNNNLQSNSNYSICHESIHDLNAQNNWFGTTDPATIDQTIFDQNEQAHLGTVNYTPFLSELNPQATPNPNAVIPTVSSYTWTTSNPTEEPTVLPTEISMPHSETANPTQPTPTQQPNSPSSITSESATANRIGGYYAALIIAVLLVTVFVVFVVRDRTKRR